MMDGNLKKAKTTFMFYYSIADFPWPLFDRDAIFTTHFYQDKETGIVYGSSFCSKEAKPLVKGLVRIETTDVTTIVEPLGNGMVKIDQRIRTDPGGNIPAWVVNMALTAGPFQNYENMKEYIKKPKYRDAELSYINENF